MISSKLSREELRARVFTTEHLNRDIRQHSIRGGFAAVFAQGARFGLRTVSTIVLARLLTPADFGLIAMVLTVTNFAMMFKDAGLVTATLQQSSISHEQVSTLFWINSILGLMLATIIAAFAPLVAWFYGESRLTMVTVVLATMFLFSGFGAQHQALLRRHMRFRTLAFVEISAMAGAVALTVTMAALGAGYWALVFKHIMVVTLTTFGCLVAMPWIPGPPSRTSGISAMLRFGFHVSGYNFVNFFARNADNVLIGRVLGASALGFYSKAYSLLMLPIQQLRTPIMSVGLPALSRLQHQPNRYRSYYKRLLQMLAFVTFPMSAFLAVYSAELVVVLLGVQWLPVAAIFQILAFAALLQSVTGTVGMVLLSSGNSKLFLSLGLFTATVSVASFLVGLPWGIRGVALSYTIANYAFVLPGTAYVLSRTPVNIRTFLRATVLPLIATLVACGISRALYLWVFRALTHEFVALSAALAVGALAYFGAYAVLPGGRVIVKEIRSMFSYLQSRSSENPQ